MPSGTHRKRIWAHVLVLVSCVSHSETLRHEGIDGNWKTVGASLVSPAYPDRAKSIEFARKEGYIGSFGVWSGGAKLGEIGEGVASAAFSLDPPLVDASFEFRGETEAPQLESFAAVCENDRLPPPQNVKIYALNTQKLQISWAKVAGAVAYEIEILENGTTIRKIENLPATATDAEVLLEGDHANVEAVVRAVAENPANTSRNSASASADLTVAPLLNAIRLGEIAKNGIYSQDFGSLPLKGKSVWRNGATLEGWRAFTNDVAITAISPTGGTATSGGIYAITNGENAAAIAFGALSAQKKPVSFGCVFTNDTPRVFSLEKVSWTAEQFSFGDRLKSTQYLMFAYAQDDSLAELPYVSGFEEMPDLALATLKTGENRKNFAFSPENLKIRPGELLYLKWHFSSPASGSSAIVGVGNVEVSFASAQGFAIKITEN